MLVVVLVDAGFCPGELSCTVFGVVHGSIQLMHFSPKDFEESSGPSKAGGESVGGLLLRNPLFRPVSSHKLRPADSFLRLVNYNNSARGSIGTSSS